MRRSIIALSLTAAWLCSGTVRADETATLSAAKDNFGRSNERNQNSGGSDILFMAHSPVLRTIVAFDLSSITNRITGAELRLLPVNTNGKPVDFVVVPMVDTANNASWEEGTGVKGAIGRNAMAGESSYSRSRFPDVPWESATGTAVAGLGDPSLWRTPVAGITGQVWRQGRELSLQLNAVALLETVRTSDHPVMTFGLWGTAGNGYYEMASKESGNGPRLILTFEKKAGTP